MYIYVSILSQKTSIFLFQVKYFFICKIVLLKYQASITFRFHQNHQIFYSLYI